jgi:hypothetical protein
MGPRRPLVPPPLTGPPLTLLLSQRLCPVPQHAPDYLHCATAKSGVMARGPNAGTPPDSMGATPLYWVPCHPECCTRTHYHVPSRCVLVDENTSHPTANPDNAVMSRRVLDPEACVNDLMPYPHAMVHPQILSSFPSFGAAWVSDSVNAQARSVMQRHRLGQNDDLATPNAA